MIRIVSPTGAVFKQTICVCVALLFLSACQSQQLGAREKGALGGAALGAGLGAIIGNQTGDTGAGIAIGSAIGALGGGLVGNEVDRNDAALDEGDRRLAQQEQQIQQNQRMIDELRARGNDVRQTDRGVVVNLPDVLFAFNSARLTPDAERTVGRISEVLQDYPDRRVSVEGHTDSVGTLEYNQRLSEDRARSVSRSLSRRGVSSSRLRTRGFGETDPIASNRSDQGRARNRRVEIIIENRY